MKNYTPARQKLKELGWYRTDRAVGPNKSIELWMPPISVSKPDLARNFKSGCKLAGIEPTNEDEN